MKIPALFNHDFPKRIQYLLCIGLVILAALTCYFTVSIIGYKVVALLLLMTVSLLAMMFDIKPVLAAAITSAVLWNFFFIPPVLTFHITHAEDVLMFFLYFVIALVNAVLTARIRDAEKRAKGKEEKENAIRLYNTLFNSLSHELKTPIASIIGAVDMLRDQDGQLTRTARGELLQEIDQAGLRLKREVENLLNMSRVETGMIQVRYDWCDFSELVSTIIRKLPVGDGQRIIFLPEDNMPLFRLDGELIGQVLYNLLHNAIRYSPAGSTVAVSVAHQAGHCVIKVADNGPGIPVAEEARVFDKFYRLSNPAPTGSGLGLSIAKGLTAAHHGQISLATNPAGGATFTVSFPVETSYINKLHNE